jgi:hypothetical protein
MNSTDQKSQNEKNANVMNQSNIRPISNVKRRGKVNKPEKRTEDSEALEKEKLDFIRKMLFFEPIKRKKRK